MLNLQMKRKGDSHWPQVIISPDGGLGEFFFIFTMHIVLCVGVGNRLDLPNSNALILVSNLSRVCSFGLVIIVSCQSLKMMLYLSRRARRHARHARIPRDPGALQFEEAKVFEAK